MPQHASVLIKNAYVITIDPARRVFTNGYVAFDDGRISAIGSMADCDVEADEVVDGRGKAVMPGMVNAYNHLIQLGPRGTRDQRLRTANMAEVAKNASQTIFGFCNRADEERSYILTRLHAIELTKAGFSAIHDSHFTNVHKRSFD